MVAINAAESNRASLRYLKEAAWGVTPGSGVARELRFKQSTLAASKDTKISEEIRADRMIPSVIEVGASSGGKISGEFSAGTWDDFLQAFVLGAWSTAMNFWQVKGTSVSITGTGEITVSGANWTGWLTANQYVKLEGFQAAANNGYFKVASFTYTGGNTVLTLTTTPLTVEAGSATTKIFDANDVILVSTATAFEAGNKINGGGSNAFAGKGLKTGQRIYVEGLGKGAGSVVCGATVPVEGGTITVSDGTDTVIFEVRTNQALVGVNNVGIALSGTPATMAATLAAAINAKFALGAFKCSATVATATVNIVNNAGAGGSIATSDSSSFTVTTFAGGSATKNGYFTILSLPDDDSIVVAETLTTDTNSGTKTVVIKGSHLRNSGTLSEIVRQSFTVETGFNDIEKYFVVNGLRVGSMMMKVEEGEIVGVEFEVKGKETKTYTATVLGNTGTYTVLPSTATEILNATANVGSVKKNGSVLSNTALKSIDLNGDANLRDQKAISSKFPAGVGTGRFSLTGKIVSYFSSFDFYNDFIDHTTLAIGFDFTDADFCHYEFRIPALKISSDPISPDGIDKDVMEEMDYVAQREPTLNTQFMVDRFSSVFPMSAA